MAVLTPFFAACAPDEVASAPAPEPAADAPSAFMDGVRMAELIAAGEMTALEAVNAAIARAEAVNDEINAIATDGFEAARALAAETPQGEFGGVPSFIKDLADSEGLQTLFGSRAFRGNVASGDGPLAAAWRAAGIIPLGKSTSPEMGLISSTEPLVTGATRNPWDTSRSPGGSSGGAAALVAAGVVPFAHASDGGGSIRIPAAVCGLFGLKPSRRAIPPGRDNQIGAPVEISMDHAVTWTVRDSAALFAATATEGASTGLITGPSERRLRIGFAPTSSTGTPVDPEVTAELQRTAALCVELGHEVVDYTLPINGEEFSDKFLLYWSAGAAQFAQGAAEFAGQPISPEILEPWTLGLAQNFLSRQDEYEAAVAYLQAFEAAYNGWFSEGGFDVLLTPTVAAPPVPIGDQAPDGDFDAVMQNVLTFAAFTSPMNVSGAASMSVPLGQTASGLPIGSMFSGKRGDDELLLALAYELEAARPWIGRRPKVWALA